VDPHLLRTFVGVARRRSFSAAAEELGYTQSAVSQQIAVLESDLGVTLLTRRPVALTEAGERLLEHAGAILLRLRAARTDVTRAAAPPAAVVRLAAAPLAMGGADVAAALMSIRAEWPRTEVTVTVTGVEGVVDRLTRGAADLALADGVATPSDPLPAADAAPVTAVGLSETTAAVVLPAAHPLATRAVATLADLVDAWWVEAPGVGAGTQRLRDVAGLDGFPIGTRYSGHDVGTLLDLVAAGHGLSVLPRHVAARHPGVVAVPLAGLVHRIELLHGVLPPGPVASLAALLRLPFRQSSNR
jgi:DNA-binding transcriptional LysR family regulator